MASPSTVISQGYGSWGSVNDVITLGYGIAVATPDAAGVAFLDEIQIYSAYLDEVPYMSQPDETPIYGAELKEER